MTNGLPTQSMVETGRLLRRWRRQPEVVTTTFVLPILLLLMYQLVLGRILPRTDGRAPLYGFVPMIAVVGAAYGAMGTGISLFSERRTGLLRRFWVLPINRWVGPIGRVAAECVRTFVATAIVLAVGMLLGLRFHQGFSGMLCALAVPVIVIAGFTPIVIAIGVSRIGDKVVQIFSIVVLVAMFFNSGFVPVTNYPGPLQPIVRAQPMSCAIEAMRGFIQGGPIATPLMQTAAWSVGIAAVSALPAIRGYRNAACR